MWRRTFTNTRTHRTSSLQYNWVEGGAVDWSQIITLKCKYNLLIYWTTIVIHCTMIIIALISLKATVVFQFSLPFGSFWYRVKVHRPVNWQGRRGSVNVTTPPTGSSRANTHGKWKLTFASKACRHGHIFKFFKQKQRII